MLETDTVAKDGSLGLAVFLFQVFLISFSGAMMPGPVTATAIAIGGRNRYAGTLIAIGHGIIEFPLIVLITLGMGKIFESVNTQIAIGLLGGIMLALMAWQMFRGADVPGDGEEKCRPDRPVLAGIILSGSNPYFLLWWATIGLALATEARQFGIWAFGMFAFMHWLCDLIWFQALSWASFKGSTLMGKHSQRIVLKICAAAMFFFGLKFIYSSTLTLIERLTT